jgi:hypothetical protein
VGILDGLLKPFSFLFDWILPDVKQDGLLVSKRGTNQFIPVIYGEQRASGITVFKRSSDISGGPWNDYLHYVIVICEGEVEELGEVYFNNISQYDSQWDSRYYHIERFTGADDQLACQTLIDHRVGWTSLSKLSGLAYLYVRLRQNKDVNKWKGEPEITVMVRGKKVKNLATGVTEYSTVPPYCLADYLTRKKYGKGADETILNIPSFVEAANKTLQTVNATENSDQTVVGNIEDFVTNWQEIDWSRGGERWEELGLPSIYSNLTTVVNIEQPMMNCNVTLDTSKSLFVNVKKLLSGMRGMMPNNDGSLTLTIEDSGPSVFSFDKSNIAGDVKVSLRGRKDKSNQVKLSFKNKALNYEDDQVVYPLSDSDLYDTWYNEDFEVELPFEVTFDTINNVPEAMQMAEVVANLGRGLQSVQFDGDDSTWVVEPGDIVDLTDTHHGFVNKPYRVESKKPQSNGKIAYTCMEHQGTIYPWADKEYYQEYPKTTLDNPFDLFPPTGVNVSVNNSQAVISWYASPDTNVNLYRIDVTDTDDESLFKIVTTEDTKYLFTGFAAGNYAAVVYASSSFGLSEGVSVSFVVDVEAQTPTLTGEDLNKIIYKPDDFRIESYINNVHFKYNTVNDFGTAVTGATGAFLTLTNVSVGDIYYIWYGDGVIWYSSIAGPFLSNQGPDGLSAFEIWSAANGGQNEAAFLETLNPADGINGNIWYSVTGTSSDWVVGIVDDFALSNGSLIYKKTSVDPHTWEFVENLTGPQGIRGVKGAKHYYIDGTVWSDSTATTFVTVTEGDVLVKWDVVTISNNTSKFSETKYYDALASPVWQPVAEVIDGNLIVFGSVKADSIDINDLFTKKITVGTVGSGNSIVIDSNAESPLHVRQDSNDMLRFVTINKNKPDERTVLQLGGGLGEGTIDSPNVFTQGLRDLLFGAAEAGGTGGTVSDSTPISITNPLTRTLTISNANSQDVSISVDANDYYTSTNSAYTPPTWRVRILRSVNDNTYVEIYDETVTGTYNYIPIDGLGDGSLNITVRDTDTDHNASDNDKLEYQVILSKISGGGNNPTLRSFLIAQAVEGGGGSGVASSATFPYVGLSTDGNSSWAGMDLINAPSGLVNENWLRVPISGLLPYNNGVSSLGSTSWNFDKIYGVNVFSNNSPVHTLSNFGKTQIDALNVDAGSVDGLQGSQLARKDAANTFNGAQTFNDGINTDVASIDKIKFKKGTAVSDDAAIEWLGSSNNGFLRFSTSDDAGGEYMEFGDYDNADQAGAFTRWSYFNRTGAYFSTNVTAPTFNGSLSGNAATSTLSDRTLELDDIGTAVSNRADTASGRVRFNRFSNGDGDGMPTSNNANGIMTFGIHPSQYTIQLGLSSDGNLYHRYNPNGGSGTWLKLLNNSNFTSYVTTAFINALNVDASTLDSYDSSKTSAGNTVAVRDASGDINARLIRSEYSNQNSSANFLVCQNALGTIDNYMRPISVGNFLSSHVTTAFINALNIQANKVTVNNSTSSSTYPVVWHNGGNSLFDTASTFNFNPAAGRLETNYFNAKDVGLNTTPISNDAYFGGFGILGNRGSFYVSNFGGGVVLNYGAVHGQGKRLETTAAGLDITGTVTVSGTVTGTDAIATSDVRVKRNFEPILNAAQKLKTVRTTTHERIDYELVDGKYPRKASIIAQDFFKFLPESITYTDDEKLGKKLNVSVPATVVMTIAAVNEHTDTIAEQAETISEQAETIVSLSERLERLEKAMLVGGLI